MSEWVSAGKVRMTPKGTYDSTAAYEILDIVTNSSGTASYVAKKAVPAGTVLTNTEYWEVIVSVEDSDAGTIEYNSTAQYNTNTVGNTLQNVESTTQKYNLVTAHSRADFVETVGDIDSYITVVDDSEGDYNIWVAKVEPNKTYFVNTDQEEIEYLFYENSPIDTTDEGDLSPGGNPSMNVSLRTSRSNIITVSDDVHNIFIAFKSSYTFTEGLVAECFIDVPYKDDTHYTASDQMAREEVNYLKSIVYNAYPTDTLSGTKVSFTDGANNIPVKSLKVDLVCTQSGSGDPSPANYRKINGKDHVYVYISNGNLYNKSTNTVGTMSNDGVVTEDPTSMVEITDFIPVKEDILVEGHIYTPSGSLPMQTVDFCTYDENKQFVRKAGLIFRQNGNGKSGLGLNANEKYVRYTITNANKNNTNYVIRTSIGYNTDWKNEAGSVYMGTVDIESGTLTVTHKYLEFDGVTNGKMFTSQSASTSNTFYLSVADASTFGTAPSNWVDPAVMAEDGLLISNMVSLEMSDTTVLPHFVAYIGASNVFQPRIKFDTNDVSDLNGANACLAEWYNNNTPFAIVYPLKTPIVYKIVPTELRTYLGENIINTNTENFTLVYRADPNLFVERKIVETQN